MCLWKSDQREAVRLALKVQAGESEPRNWKLEKIFLNGLSPTASRNEQSPADRYK